MQFFGASTRAIEIYKYTPELLLFVHAGGMEAIPQQNRLSYVKPGTSTALRLFFHLKVEHRVLSLAVKQRQLEGTLGSHRMSFWSTHHRN
jgi:hypothetical protein